MGRDAESQLRGIVQVPPKIGKQAQKIVHVAKDEAALALGRRFADATVCVEDGQQGQADAGLVGRGDDPLRHLGHVGVGMAFRVVMQIVELADAGVARLQHLQIGLRGDGLELVGVEHASKRVHAAAPGPEVVGAGGGMRTNELGAAGQRPLMGVRMQVDHARQHVTIEALEPAPVLGCSASTEAIMPS